MTFRNSDFRVYFGIDDCCFVLTHVMFLDQQLETTHATTLSEFQLRRRDYKHWNSR